MEGYKTGDGMKQGSILKDLNGRFQHLLGGEVELVRVVAVAVDVPGFLFLR